MALQTSGTLTLQQIGSEFGVSPPFQFSDLYRGGNHVGFGVAAGSGSFQTAPMTPNAGPVQIPTSGTLEVSHFYGTDHTTGPVDSIVPTPNTTCRQVYIPTTPTTCSIYYHADGTITFSGTGHQGTSTISTGPSAWNTLNGSGHDYSSEYHFVITNITNGGETTISPNTTGDQGGFVAMGASCLVGGTLTASYTIQIVRQSDGVVMTTFTASLSLDNT